MSTSFANKQAPALLLALGVATESVKTISRPDLEALIRQAAHDRVLAPFTPTTWRRRLYESLAHLEQTGQIAKSDDGYVLTQEGAKALKNLGCKKDVQDRIREDLQGYMLAPVN